MNLKEILQDVNLLVTNSISDEVKVRWLNQVQRQVYRDYAFPDTTHLFKLEAGKTLYSLPDNCSRDRITSVIVGNKSYEFKSPNQDVTSHCYSIADDKLWLYPTPKHEEDAYLNYRPRPRDMRVDMQEAAPDFPEDFHELLVYGIALRTARASQDHQKTRELEEDFIMIEEEAKRKLRPYRKKSVIINRMWG